MKRILFAMAIVVLALAGVRPVEARTDVSIDFFYDSLGSGGNWVEVGDYGYCWQPTVAVSTGWRPYADGYWAYTDLGWTWVSYEDFGWATYHYGRWVRLRDRGWFWVPGREWGPAWVSWRTGGDYVGWAPLPSRGGGELVYESGPITARVDIDFDIGPAYYNFVDVRYIGEPLLRERIYAPEQNVTYIRSTVNVTNITYSNSTYYNYGPDYNTLSRYSTRPIQRLTLQRESNADLNAAVQSKSLMKVQGDKLVVAAPPVFQKPPSPIAPKVVKEKIQKPTMEHGWTAVSDPKAQEELKAKMKSEDAKNIPPPTIKPKENAETAQSPAGASPAAPTTSATPATSTASVPPVTGASPSVAATPATTPATAKDKPKDKQTENVPPSTATSPGTTPEKNKNKRNEKAAPLTTPSSSTAPATAPTPPREKNKRKPAENPPSTNTPPPSGITEGTTNAPAPEKKKSGKGPVTSAPTDTTNATTPASIRAARVKKPTDKVERPTPPPATTAPVEAPKRETAPETRVKPQKNAPMPPERVAPPGPAANAPVKGPEVHGKDKKKNEPAASPTP
jgi:hypothetical protein